MHIVYLIIIIIFMYGRRCCYVHFYQFAEKTTYFLSWATSQILKQRFWLTPIFFSCLSWSLLRISVNSLFFIQNVKKKVNRPLTTRLNAHIKMTILVCSCEKSLINSIDSDHSKTEWWPNLHTVAFGLQFILIIIFTYSFISTILICRYNTIMIHHTHMQM